MSRPTKFFVPNEWYHCYSRGIDKRIVFENLSDYPKLKAFLEASTESEIKQTLAQLDLNSTYKPSNTFGSLSLMQVVAALGKIAHLKELLSDQKMRDKIDANDNFALINAAAAGHLEVVKELLTYEKVRDKIDADDNRALRWAAREGHLEVLKVFLTY